MKPDKEELMLSLIEQAKECVHNIQRLLESVDERMAQRKSTESI